MIPPEPPAHGLTKRIAGSEPCSVDRCHCGCVHVHIGSFTVRLGEEAFLDMATVIGAAAAALAEDTPRGHRH